LHYNLVKKIKSVKRYLLVKMDFTKAIQFIRLFEFIFLLLTFVKCSHIENKSPLACPGEEDGFYSDLASNCQFYIVCQRMGMENESISKFKCQDGLLFDELNQMCNWAKSVNCEKQVEFENDVEIDEKLVLPQEFSFLQPMINDAKVHTIEYQTMAKDNSSQLEEVEVQCPNVNDGYYADKELGCKFYIVCQRMGSNHQQIHRMHCPEFLLFDEERQICNWAEEVKCDADDNSDDKDTDDDE